MLCPLQVQESSATSAPPPKAEIWLVSSQDTSFPKLEYFVTKTVGKSSKIQIFFPQFASHYNTPSGNNQEKKKQKVTKVTKIFTFSQVFDTRVYRNSALCKSRFFYLHIMEKDDA